MTVLRGRLTILAAFHANRSGYGRELGYLNEIEIEIEDDTPVEDRGREPLPKDLVNELEADELEDYSDKLRLV